MKQDIIFEIIKKAKSQPSLMRKLKIFAVVGLVGSILVGALVVWAGVTAIKFVTAQTSQLTQSPLAKEQVENLKTTMSDLPRIKPLTCWGKAQSLMAVQPWVEQPLMNNLMSLKVACLEQAPEKLINKAEGGTI